MSTRNFEGTVQEATTSVSQSASQKSYFSSRRTPSEKIDVFMDVYGRRMFAMGMIHEGIFLVGFSALKRYGTSIGEEFADDIIIAQAPQDMLKMYVAKVEEVRKIAGINGNFVKRMLAAKVYWISESGDFELLYDNNDWLRAPFVEETMDKIAAIKGYTVLKNTKLSLSKTKLSVSGIAGAVLNVWHKAYQDVDGNVRNLISQIEAGATLDVTEDEITKERDYNLAYGEGHVSSRFLRFEISPSGLRKFGLNQR